MGANPG